MGNIFKTLGLDDLVRDIPFLGKVAGDVLAGLPMGQKSGPGSGQDSFLPNMTYGKTEGRMSNEDYQFNQDLLDSSNPRDAARQNEFNNLTTDTNIANERKFLEGVAPSQAAAHNTFQDATYQAGIDRETAGIKSQAAALGMSPWELTGQSTGGGGGAIPPPSPRPQGGRTDGSAFLSTMTPLAVAKMQNQTAIKTAKIQQDTALKTTAMTTQQQDKSTSMQTAGGKLPVQQAATLATQAESAIASAGLARAQTDIQTQDLVLRLVRLAMEVLPKEQLSGTVDVPGFKGSVNASTIKGFEQLLRALNQSPTAKTGYLPKDAEAARKMLSSMPPQQFAELSRAITRIANTAGKAGNSTLDFLGNLGK